MCVLFGFLATLLTSSLYQVHLHQSPSFSPRTHTSTYSRKLGFFALSSTACISYTIRHDPSPYKRGRTNPKKHTAALGVVIGSFS